MPKQCAFLGLILTSDKKRSENHVVSRISPCSTCKKAKQWLDAHGIAYTARHIKEENPTYDELKHWLETSSLPVKKFFNTSGLLYKSMALKDKLPAMSVDEQLQLLSTDGMLVKRPLVVTEDGKVLTRFREMEWEETLL